MNNLTLFVIISIFVIICLSKIYIVYCKNNLEHLTANSDEAIQNLASLYNTDQLTIGKINATGKVESEQIQSKFIKTDRLQLGDKWILTGSGKDAAGVDDTWLRFMNPGQTKEPAGGGIAVGTIYDYSMANTIKGYIDGGFGTVGSMKNIKDNTRCPDGWDLTGEFGTGSLDDCGNQCRARFPTALCAQYRKSDGHCWCKSVMGFQPGTDTNFQAKLIPY